MPQPEQAERDVEPVRADPVRAPMVVGAVDDVAEIDADRRADAALGWLAGQQPAEQATPGRHIHTAGCGVARSHAPAGAVAVGYAGGALDPDTQAQIEAAVGGGESLETPVRRTMEAAFGADLGKVRVHRGANADRLSRSISAEAFTTGNDVFFADGAYDPTSARGQRVLAHELGHVMQGASGSPEIARLANPFAKTTDAEKAERARKTAEKNRADEEKKATKVAEEKKKAEEKRLAAEQKKKDQVLAADKKKKDKQAAVDRKNEIKGVRSANKADDKDARSKAKVNNAAAAELTTNLKLTYQANPTSKLLTPTDIANLQGRFAQCLADEKKARDDARAGAPAGSSEAQIESLTEAAALAVWDKADADVQLMRPLRFDEFDKALNEVNELALEGRADLAGQSSQRLVDNEAAYGAPLDPAKATKQVLEQRALERRKARALAKSGKHQEHADKAKQKGDDAVAKTKEMHVGVTPPVGGSPRTVGPLEEGTLRTGAASKLDKESFDKNDDLETARGGLKTGAGVVDKLGMGVKHGTKGVVTLKVSEKNDGTDIAGLVGSGASAFSQILTMVSDILGMATHMADMKQGVADSGARIKLAGQAAGTFNNAAKITKSTLVMIETGLKAFDSGSPVLQQVGTGIPVVGIITSTLGLVQGALELIPTVKRHAAGITNVEEALLERRAPLAASFDRVNSRTAQLIEQSAFTLGKQITMLATSIAELCTAGGMGIPAAIKLGVTIVDLLHTVAHKIYDTVGESKSSTALKNFKVKHQEGASRDVLKYDIGSSVDVLIVAAKKHKLPYARTTLVTYGVKENEIDSMWLEELREKVLDGLDAEGNPKTVTEKVTAAKESVMELFGEEKKPAGPKEESTALQKVAAVPGKIGGAIASLPGKIKKKITSMKESYADAQDLVKHKNAQNHGNKTDRGSASTLFYTMRGADKNEKSLAKIRTVAADQGVAPDDLPRTIGDKAERAKIQAKRDVGPDADISGPIRLDNAFIAQVCSATSAQLFEIVEQISSVRPISLSDLAKIRFVEVEAAARLSQPGVTSMPGARS